MIISREKYEKLVARNKYLTEEVHELEKRNKRLTLENDIYYKGAIKWRIDYDKMRELFDNREVKSPIVEQRDAEIEALKHMLERTEAKHKDLKTNTRALNKENDKLAEELSTCQQKLNYLRDIFKANLEIAVSHGDVGKARMWQTFLMEVECYA